MNINLGVIEGIVRLIFTELPNDRNVIHAKLQTSICDLAQVFELKSDSEYPARSYWGNKSGLIDVVWLENDKPVVAFEIDSSFREKSIRKLLSLDVEHRVWFYYGYKKIDVRLKDMDIDGRIFFVDLKRGSKKNKTELSGEHNVNRKQSDASLKPKEKAYSVTSERMKYSNAYLPWTKESDSELMMRYQAGIAIGELAKIFSRKPSAIRSRLRKLKLLSQ